MRLQPTLRIAARIVVVSLACILIIRLTPPNNQVTGPLRFRAVTHTPPLAPPAKVDTDLYLKIGNRSVLLGLQDYSTYAGFSVSVEHPNPSIAKRVAELVARNYQVQKMPNQSCSFPEDDTNR